MNEQERDQLLQEREILITLLNFHVKHKERIDMTTQEFEEYVNTVLDRLIEIKNKLGETEKTDNEPW